MSIRYLTNNVDVNFHSNQYCFNSASVVSILTITISSLITLSIASAAVIIIF